MGIFEATEMSEETLDFAKMLEESGDVPGEGKVATGTVIKLTADFAIVDIGYKSEGLVTLSEFKDFEGKLGVAEGDKIEVLVERLENEDGMVVLSKDKADKIRVWDQISAAAEEDETVEGRIVARIKGGLAVDIGVRAFLPGSQVALRPVRQLEKLIGETFDFKIIKFNRRRGNIVLSRRVILEKERESQRKFTMEKLAEGAVLTGIVKNITDYGAFIDLGGIDGLLHVTDMSWGRVNHPSEMFEIGDEVKVKVLSFDAERERVSLGYKQLEADPWIAADEKYPIGDKVNGKVVSITDYGCFIELEKGIEGLVHISEMSWTKRISHPSEKVSIGDVMEIMVLNLDIDRKRISLGIKQCEPNPWDMLEQSYPVGTVVKGSMPPTARRCPRVRILRFGIRATRRSVGSWRRFAPVRIALWPPTTDSPAPSASRARVGRCSLTEGFPAALSRIAPPAILVPSKFRPTLQGSDAMRHHTRR